MNYFALAGAIIAGLLALTSLLRIVFVGIGVMHWSGRGGFVINLAIVAVTAPLTFWIVGEAL